MMNENITTRIQKELITLKAKEVKANNDLRYKHQSGMGVYDLLQDVERIQKRRVELETALKILGELK